MGKYRIILTKVNAGGLIPLTGLIPVNENNLTFLMHESTLRTLMHQRISTNKSIDEINDQTDECSDVEYI